MSHKAEARFGGSVAKDGRPATDRMGTDVVIRSSLGLDPAEDYKMDNKQRGLAVIFNQKHFKDQEKPRSGTNVDRDSLEKRLKELNFEVKVYNDFNKKKVLNKIHEAAEADHSDADCFLLVFLSHGGNDENGKNPYVSACDDKISIQDITSMFKGDKCKSLVGKPKIFILQACRGNKFDDPVSACSADDSEMDEVVEDTCAIETLPAGADFIMCYSTAEGYYSMRHSRYGSWYIQDLCELLPYGKSIEFTDLLTLVARKVSMRSSGWIKNMNANGKKQVPCFASMLTKKLYFRPKNTSRSFLHQCSCCFSNSGVCQPSCTSGSVAEDSRAATDRMAWTENLPETFSLIRSSLDLDAAEEYKMDNKQRGLALILTLNETGANADRDNLERSLDELNFKVKTYNTSNKEEVFKKITEAAEADHLDEDCFLLVYLGHSENGGKTDGKNAPVFDEKTIQNITSLFKGDKCKSLVGKPKIFILQASRGEKYDDPVTACSADERDEMDTRPFPTLPAGADFIICYSVAEGYSSHQDTTNGSWYIQDLCEMLQKYGDTLEFKELLMQVNRKVSLRSLKEQDDANEKKQLPCFASMLTKKLYFRSKK
ncbi:uncharacterized protein ABDE67_012131 isoform 2-T2 [Symphorus nematophorus]